MYSVKVEQDKFNIDILEFVKTVNIEGLFEYLNNFKDTLSIDSLEADKLIRKKLNAIKDDLGDSLLHIAVRINSKKMVDMLLFYELNLSVKNKDSKTPLMLAKELLQEKKVSSDLVVLLSIKENWQDKVTDFNFSRAVGMINKAFVELTNANGHNKVLLIGPTGSGKSTLLNYLNGTKYELYYRKAAALCARPIKDNDVIEVAKTGTVFGESQTLYPQVLKKPGLDFVYCDLAGLFDTRGKEEQICAAISAMLLSKSKGDIKSIMIVLDYPSFISTKGDVFKNIAYALSLITKNNSELINSVLFMITKVPPQNSSNPDFIVGFFDKLILPLLSDIRDSDDLKDRALYVLLSQMAERRGQIFCPDITDNGQSRRMVIDSIQALKPVSGELFNFNNFDNSQDEFNAVLLDIVKGFLEVKRNIEKNIPEAIAKIQEIRTGISASIRKCRLEMEGLELERKAQEAMDSIINLWIEVEKLKQNSKQDLSKINDLLKESNRLMQEILNIPQATVLPQTIGWLSILVSVDPDSRKGLLKEQMQERRWQLPWDKNAQGKFAGPDVYLVSILAKDEERIVELDAALKELTDKELEYNEYTRNLKMEMGVLKDVYDIAYRIINVLGYGQEIYNFFVQEYLEYYQFSKNTEGVELIFSRGKTNDTSTLQPRIVLKPN